MNITRALNAALPEIPARAVAEHQPRLDPRFTFKEHLDDGERVIRVYIPSVEAMYKFADVRRDSHVVFQPDRNGVHDGDYPGICGRP
jgi:hypothetical protein